MSVIVVGDIDVVEMEKKIISHLLLIKILQGKKKNI
jgi:predicted Zn-dependent peptidase